MTADPIDVPKIQQVSAGVHVRVAIDNLTWIDTGEYLVVVDALEQPELKDEVLAAIDATAGSKPIKYLLLTHTHYDHVALNEAFTARGARIVHNADGEVPAEGLVLEGTQRTVRFIPMGGCHTEEDCVVHVPEDRVLCTGDIFGWGLIPLTRSFRHQTAEFLLATYQRMIDLDAAVVVPGHGPLCTTAELRRWCEYFNWLRESVSQAVAEGLDDAAIDEKCPPPQDMTAWWRFVQWKHADSLTRVRTAVRRGRLN